MNLVRAGFHDEIKQAARGAAIFRAHAAGFHFEFLQGFGRRALLVEIARPISGGGGAVEQNFLGELRRAVDFGSGGAARHAGRKLDREVFRVAAAAAEIEWQFVDLAVLQHLPDNRAVRLKHLGTLR